MSLMTIYLLSPSQLLDEINRLEMKMEMLVE